MFVKKLQIRGYRSLRQLELELGQLNVICGPNGCGKSNLYKAVKLMHEASRGQLSAALAQEGGIQKALWAGEKRTGESKMQLSAMLEDFDYEIQLGYEMSSLSNTLFSLDPSVKSESLWMTGHRRRPSSRLVERVNQTAKLTNFSGEQVRYPLSIAAHESIFGQLSEPHLYPEVSQLREVLQGWRFYHEFAVWPGSPLRLPQVGIRSPVLAHDGHNLAAAFQTINEIGNHELLHRVLSAAFPDSEFFVDASMGRFQIMMQRKGIFRPLEATELSDGTLRFLCLAVAMLSPRPPAFMAFNEPENSLHPSLMPALAMLLAETSRYSQLWVTSHSPELAALIRQHTEIRYFELKQQSGETVMAEDS
ncbi:AAA family ATPase [Rouxiella badensis]|uniref:AAA family ATPase n=1 Tax=Rouxiella badensis TaxID=1646377 RepID=UPI001D15B86C|nr:AAA family ATPase [Rouxiella badensis]MCC3718393.1 AAA family ATPase [Rouxiella badensis]MCC3726839.1 AAA family ATPase [Rouxiella badensis]MCC3738812.1 AAA family ATPase [Rouxiella badensis]MCC3746617.1 AAA family ATPase [Rouxiella badensis]WAT09949.1 AAA family ATPase [Rouxiella badensis]